MIDGQKLVAAAGTPVPLLATVAGINTTKAIAVYIQPLPTNTGSIYVGGSTVKNKSAGGGPTGMILNPGDTQVEFPAGNAYAYSLDQIYINSDVSGEGVTFLYIR